MNATKTLMKGRYNNGGVFADFVLPADADVYDVSNYLRYGEYKVVFEPCWRALNNALVPTRRWRSSSTPRRSRPRRPRT